MILARLRNHLMAAGLTWLLPPCGAAHAAVIVPAGPASVLISQEQRQALGLRNGPDSIVDIWNDGGQTYLVFSGAADIDGRRAGGATFRLAVDASLRHIMPPLQVVLRAPCRGARPAQGRACSQFDSDYAGAGVVVPCPGGATLYIYHGENHTRPDGAQVPGNLGWTGIGQATWSASQGQFMRNGQILGLNASDLWQNTPTGLATGQTPAASGNPSVVPDPTGMYLYAYFGERSASPDAAGAGLQCTTRTCWGVARARQADVCASAAAGRAAPWQIWYNGAFTQPGLIEGATGGSFTAILNHADGVDNLANVTALPALHEYAMVSVLRPSGAIVARSSTDGLHWSAPAMLVPPPEPGTLNSYARIVPVPAATPPRYALLYVARHAGSWEWAELLRQDVKVTK
jgi:hypothetical protein